MESFDNILFVILGGVMLYYLIRYLNRGQREEGKKPAGPIVTIIIVVIVIAIWILIAKIN